MKKLTLSIIALVSAQTVFAESIEDLSALSLEQLMNVNIIGASKYEQKQSEVGAAVSVITRNEIKAFGWRTMDEILASLPGTHTMNDRQYNYVGTRGFGLPGDFNTRILLTINGNRVNDSVYDQAYLGRDFPVDIDLIERVEFIPGPGGAVYGQNALFGVINVITRKGESVNGAEVATAYHHAKQGGEGRATWGKKLDNGTDVLLSASGYKAQGENHFFDFGEAGVSGVAKNMDGERDKEFFSHVTHEGLSFDFSYGDRRKDTPTAAYFSDPLTSGQYTRDRHLLTQVQYQKDFADNTLHFFSRAFLGRERVLIPLTFGGVPNIQRSESDWQGFETRLLSTNFTNHKLMLGLDYQANTKQHQTADDLTTPKLDVNIQKSGYRAGVYVQDEWTLFDTLSATLGIRFDNNDVTGSQLSPRAALIWQATTDTTIKGLYGRAHRAPNAYERNYDDGETQEANLNLNGETIDTMEIILDHRLSRDLNLRASIYQWNMQGLVTLGVDSKSNLPQYQSGEDVKANGVELSADKTWNWGGRLRGSTSYQDVAYKNGASLNNSPQWLGKLNFSSPLFSTGLRLGYEVQYYSERQTLNGSKLDGYSISNANIMADKWVKGLEVSLGVYNLLDTRYEVPASGDNWQNSFQQDGRQFRLKALYAF